MSQYPFADGKCQSFIVAVSLFGFLTTGAHAGQGFLSPAPGTDSGSQVWLHSAPEGQLWSVSGSLLHSSTDGGRSWRFWEGAGHDGSLQFDPADSRSMLLASFTELSYSHDSGLTWTAVERQWSRIFDFTPTTRGWFALLDDDVQLQPHRSTDLGVTWQRSSGGGGTRLVAARDASRMLSWDNRNVWVSTDLGQSFSRNLFVPNSEGNIVSLNLGPRGGRNVVVITGLGHVYWSTDGGQSFERAVLPGGVSIFTSDSAGSFRTPAFFHPDDDDLLLVRVVDGNTDETRLFRTGDGGRTWQLIESEELAPKLQTTSPIADPCRPATLYTVAGDRASVLRSDDFGITWNLQPSQFPGNGILAIRQLLPVTDGCGLLAVTSSGLMSSSDRGASWQLSKRGQRSGRFPSVAFDPSQPERLLAAGDGVARSTDSGRSWQVLDNTLAGREVTQVLVHPDGTVLAEARLDGTISAFFRSNDHGNTFSQVVFGDDVLESWVGSGSVASDPKNPSRVLAVSHTVGTIESLDFGRTWRLVGQASGQELPWGNVFFDPRDDNRLWGAGSRAVTSEDGGATWRTLAGRSANFLTMDPASRELWIGVERVLLSSTDEGATWDLRYQIDPLQLAVNDLAFDRRSPGTMWLSVLAKGDGASIWRTTDSGDTWSPRDAGYGPSGAFAVAQDPVDATRWIVAGPEGLHWYDDQGSFDCPSYDAPGLCLRNDRFEISVDWRDFTDRSGAGHVAPLRSQQSGLFTFFNPDNWEVMLKVLDGCALNDHFWVFSAATTNVDYTIRVTDRFTGRYRQYFNFLGENAPAVADTAAFRCIGPVEASIGQPGPSALPALAAATPAVSCGNPEEPALCLGEGGRFRLTTRWRDFDGNEGEGLPVGVSSADSGLFTFFDPTNWEVMVKVLDGCALNGRYWVFGAATTTVEFELEVTDQATGEVRTYSNPLGQAAETILDTDAFAACDAG